MENSYSRLKGKYERLHEKNAEACRISAAVFDAFVMSELNGDPYYVYEAVKRWKQYADGEDISLDEVCSEIEEEIY